MAVCATPETVTVKILGFGLLVLPLAAFLASLGCLGKGANIHGCRPWPMHVRLQKLLDRQSLCLGRVNGRSLHSKMITEDVLTDLLDAHHVFRIPGGSAHRRLTSDERPAALPRLSPSLQPRLSRQLATALVTSPATVSVALGYEDHTFDSVSSRRQDPLRSWFCAQFRNPSVHSSMREIRSPWCSMLKFATSIQLFLFCSTLLANPAKLSHLP